MDTRGFRRKLIVCAFVISKSDSISDMKGNEHVTRTFPDGQEEYRINGVIQPTEERAYLPGPPPNSMHPPHEYNAGVFPPPPIISSRSRHQSPEYDGPYNSGKAFEYVL